jgi:hypothetical protein
MVMPLGRMRAEQVTVGAGETVEVESGASPWRIRVSDASTGLVLPVGPWQNPEGGEWFPATGGRTVVPLPVGSWRVEGFAPDGTTHQRQVQVAGETQVTFGGGS